MDVCEVNKEDDLVVTHRIAGHISEQYCAFMEGLGNVPPCACYACSTHEHELQIGSMTEIDMDDWTRFADYRGYG